VKSERLWAAKVKLIKQDMLCEPALAIEHALGAMDDPTAQQTVEKGPFTNQPAMALAFAPGPCSFFSKMSAAGPLSLEGDISDRPLATETASEALLLLSRDFVSARAAVIGPPTRHEPVPALTDPDFGPRWHLIWHSPTTGGQLFVRDQPLWTGRTKALADIAYFVKERNDSRHSDKLAVRPRLKEGEFVGIALNGDGSLKLPTKGCPKSHQRKSKYFWIKRCSHGVVVGNSAELLLHADRLESEESDVIEFVFKREEKGGRRQFSLTIADNVTTFTTETFEVSSGRCPEQMPRIYRALRSSEGGPDTVTIGVVQRGRRKATHALPSSKVPRPRRHLRSKSAETEASLPESEECQSAWLANALVMLTDSR